jgi:hypothetical protein
MGLTRRPETSVNFKHLIPPSNPQTPDSTTYHGVSPKSHFICVVMPKDVWHNNKIWDISHSVGAVTQGATRNILCIRASSWSASLLPDALAQYMFLLHTALFSPGYFYWICVLILLRTNKLDRTVKAFGGSWFESRPEQQLPSLIFSWVSSVSPAKCRDGTTDFLPHFFRPIVQYCTIIRHYLVLLLRESVNKLQFTDSFVIKGIVLWQTGYHAESPLEMTATCRQDWLRTFLCELWTHTNVFMNIYFLIIYRRFINEKIIVA